MSKTEQTSSAVGNEEERRKRREGGREIEIDLTVLFCRTWIIISYNKRAFLA